MRFRVLFRCFCLFYLILSAFNSDSVEEEKELQCFVFHLNVEFLKLSFYISVQNFSSVYGYQGYKYTQVIYQMPLHLCIKLDFYIYG